ncbi:hypothetical protein K0M31_018748 [Melipona bicolor]|uniref:Uncharacterized protein n=1 Tax=Melipona bicolor TaxID=60889 RepID=A0AA40KRZ0_9HYME|nr:hypothetical protein K0M31_018748 [Melipona bicolor]
MGQNGLKWGLWNPRGFSSKLCDLQGNYQLRDTQSSRTSFITLSRVEEHLLRAQPYDLAIQDDVFMHLRKVYRLGSVFNQASWEKLEITSQLKYIELHWHTVKNGYVDIYILFIVNRAHCTLLYRVIEKSSVETNSLAFLF